MLGHRRHWEWNSCYDSSHRPPSQTPITSIPERPLICALSGKAEEIDAETLCPEVSSSILPFWKIQYWEEMHGDRRGLPCISFHLNMARRSPYMPNGPNLGPEITEKAARVPAGFAHRFRQSQQIRFLCANLRPFQKLKSIEKRESSL